MENWETQEDAFDEKLMMKENYTRLWVMRGRGKRRKRRTRNNKKEGRKGNQGNMERMKEKE